MMRRPTDDSAAFAANWRRVLAVDALIGAAALVAGMLTVFAVNAAFGGVVAAAGLAYLALVTARARRWSRLRRSGAPTGDC